MVRNLSALDFLLNPSSPQVSGFTPHPSEAPPPSDLGPPTSAPSPSVPVSQCPSVPPPSILAGLRVCFLAGTLGQGGAERQLFYIIKALVESGAKVDLLCLTQGEFWESQIQQLGVRCHYVGQHPSRLARLWAVARAVKRLQPQVLQAQHFYTNIYCGFAGRLNSIPSIGAIRNDGNFELQCLGSILGKLSLHLPDLIAANSQSAIRNLTGQGHTSRYAYLPNVVDTNRFQPLLKPNDRGEFVVLGMGRLAPQKRFDRFIDIISGLQLKNGKPVRGLIAGDGPERPHLQKCINKISQATCQIDLVGRVSDPLSLYQNSDVFLLTSDHEGTPNVIMEAMACGMPVVAPNVGGIESLVEHLKTGMVFAPASPREALSALQRLGSDLAFASALGGRARDYIERQHSVARLPLLLAGLYARLSNN